MTKRFPSLIFFVIAILQTTAAPAQQADARDFELGYFARNNTVAVNAYARRESADEIENYTLNTGLLRVTHVLKKGDWAFAPLDVLLPVADISLYTPATPSSPANLTLHGSGVGDLLWIPTFGGGLVQDAALHTHTWFAFTSYVSVPTGTYDPAKLVNIGSNRWAVRPQLMLGQRFAKAVTVEGFVNLGFSLPNEEYRLPPQVVQAAAAQNPAAAAVLGGDKKLTQEISIGAGLLTALDLSETFYVSASYYYSKSGKQTVEGVPWSPQAVPQNLHTFRFGLGMRILPHTQLLFQLNQDAKADGGAGISRGFFVRVTHLFALGAKPPPPPAPPPPGDLPKG